MLFGGRIRGKPVFTYRFDVLVSSMIFQIIYTVEGLTTVVTFQFIRAKCRSEISTKTPSATFFFHNQSGVLRLIAFQLVLVRRGSDRIKLLLHFSKVLLRTLT